MDVRAGPATWNGRQVMVVVATDATEREEAEGTLVRLNRLYSILYAANEALVRARDQQRLFEEVCGALVEGGAWFAPWREAMRQGGFRAAASFPLRVGGQTTGVLSLYGKNAVPFADRDLALLDQLATSLSSGLDVLTLLQAIGQRGAEVVGVSTPRRGSTRRRWPGRPAAAGVHGRAGRGDPQGDRRRRS